MTDTVQPLAVSLVQQSGSEQRILDEATHNILKSSANQELSSKELAYAPPKADDFNIDRSEHNSFGLHLKQQQPVFSSAIGTSSSFQANSGGRCNPEPDSEKSQTREATRTTTTFSACVDVSATKAQVARQQGDHKNKSEDKAIYSMAGGTPVTESVKVQVIRPYAVKTAPQTAGTPRVEPAVAVASRPNAPRVHDPAHQRLDMENGPVNSDTQEEARLRGEGVRQAQQEQRNRQEEATARLKEQQYQRQGEVRRLQASQCNFPVRPGMQRPPDARAVEAMATTDGTGQQIIISHRHHAAGGYDQGGQQGYPLQQGRAQPSRRSLSYSTSIGGASSGGRKQPHARSTSAGSANMDIDGGQPSVPPTPLFERLVSEEVQEIKAYARLVENQNSRLAELERVHEELEQRLRSLTKERMQLEATLEDRERSWSSKFALLEKDRDNWKDIVQAERSKNAKLLEQLGRKDMDIHRMLARKYDQHRDQHNISHSVRNYKAAPSHGERSATPPATIGNTKTPSSSPGTNRQHKSPHEILNDSGTVEVVRERNVANSLLDFFGM